VGCERTIDGREQSGRPDLAFGDAVARLVAAAIDGAARTPQPDSVVLHAEAKWSRPIVELMLGVRPNSASVMTSVFDSNPRSSRSSSSVAIT